ncbi:UNVERIFIED_CONTAM: hypothetical protein RMT77_007746 [Armadillidium vulgare]
MDVFEDESPRDGNTTEEELIHLFRICDRRDKGFIIREELEELCSSLGITKDESDVLFNDLDVDNDGKISFEDFSLGFAEFLSPEDSLQGKISFRERRRTSMWSISSELNKKSEEHYEENGDNKNSYNENDRLSKESVYQAWTSFTSSLVDSNLLSLSQESQSQVRQLCKELQCKSIPVNVANKVECAVSSLVKEMEQLQKENKNLEKLYQREKKTHLKRLKCLEDEIEGQVTLAEERAKEKLRQETEEEKRKIEEKMSKEFTEMQAHLKLYQKVESWLKNEHGADDERYREVRRKLEESNISNRDLEMNLQDASTNIALLRTDLAHSRLQYDEKCKELHREREQMYEYMHQYEHLRRQLDLIHDANKRLQDTNDCLRENVDAELRFGAPLSRSSSVRSSNIRNLCSSQSASPVQREQEDTKFGISRLLDDLDSGLSTLPDKAEDTQITEQENELSPIKDTSKLDPNDVENIYSSLQEARDSNSSSPSFRTYIHRMPNAYPLHPFHINKEGMENEKIEIIIGPSDSLENVRTPDRTYKIVMAGDAAVGKTTFITRIYQGVFVSSPASTLGIDYKVKSMMVDGKHMVLQLWDTAGQEKYRSITKSYFRRADGVLLLYDVTSERSFLNVRQWLQNIEETCESGVPIIICGNKKDLKESHISEGFTVVTRPDGEKLAKEHGATFFETSTKTGENVLSSLEELARQMSAHEDLTLQTSALNVMSSKKKHKCCFSSKYF